MRKKGAALRAALEGDLGPDGGGAAPPPSAVPLPIAARQGGQGEGAPIPHFTPVPRRYRHDGWTPERQKAFIEALADTGCVDRAARMVNMAQTNCYTLRRAPGAEEFRRAWDAALDFGLKRLKDIAFERAIEGQLVPVFAGGKLMGFRRKRNDALLMFCLRHYGRDGEGRRTTINYFSTRASAGGSDRPSPGPSREREGSLAEASTTVRTVITGPGPSGDKAGALDSAAGVLEGFEGVRLDAEAQAAIAAALEACAARAREAGAAIEQGGLAARDAIEDDLDEPFLRIHDGGPEYRGELVPPVELEEFVPFVEDERPWTDAGADVVEWVAAPERPSGRRADATAAPRLPRETAKAGRPAPKATGPTSRAEPLKVPAMRSIVGKAAEGSLP